MGVLAFIQDTRNSPQTLTHVLEGGEESGSSPSLVGKDGAEGGRRRAGGT